VSCCRRPIANIIIDQVAVECFTQQSPKRRRKPNNKHLSKNHRKYDTSLISESITQLQRKRRDVESTIAKLDIAAEKDFYKEVLDEIDEHILGKRVEMLNMYKELKAKEQRRFNSGYLPFSLPRVDYERLTKDIPRLLVPAAVRVRPKKTLTLMSDEVEAPKVFRDIFHGFATSTYPFMEYKNSRDGDPICDQFRVMFAPRNTIVAMADGCNWGNAPAEAARRATKGFVDLIHRERERITDTNRLCNLFLSGLCAAHNAIIKGDDPDRLIGTTTLMGGMVLQLLDDDDSTPSNNNLVDDDDDNDTDTPPSSASTSAIAATATATAASSSSSTESASTTTAATASTSSSSLSSSSSSAVAAAAAAANGASSAANKNWGFILASIGDCKAFQYRTKTREIIELTPNSRNENACDASDCGGRLGPYIDGGPDLRNIGVFVSRCEEDDIVFICSDGVHDNFDPQHFGLSPREYGVDADQWQDGEPELVNTVKAKYRSARMLELLQDVEHVTPEILTTRFVNFCIETTRSSQEFMQQNLGKKLPADYSRFPGKMDHTTLIALRVCEVGEQEITEARAVLDLEAEALKAALAASAASNTPSAPLSALDLITTFTPTSNNVPTSTTASSSTATSTSTTSSSTTTTTTTTTATTTTAITTASPSSSSSAAAPTSTLQDSTTTTSSKPDSTIDRHTNLIRTSKSAALSIRTLVSKAKDASSHEDFALATNDAVTHTTALVDLLSSIDELQDISMLTALSAKTIATAQVRI
jgi:hypothetical protein